MLLETGASEARRITTSDTQVGTDEWAALQARHSSTRSVELTAPPTPGSGGEPFERRVCVEHPATP